MRTLRVGRGYTASWTVTLRRETGAVVADTYDGGEPLSLVVCDADGAAVALSGSSAAWLDPAAGTITVTLDDSDTASLGPGPRGLSVGLTTGGETYEVFRAVLRVEPRPTGAGGATDDG